MNDRSEDEYRLKDYGVRNVMGSYNINSGRLEEVKIEVSDPEHDGETWWTVVYDIDLGEAQIKYIPNVGNPHHLAEILTRSDAAVLQVEHVDNVITWQDIYMKNYGSPDLELDDIAKSIIPQNLDELVDDHTMGPYTEFMDEEDETE